MQETAVKRHIRPMRAIRRGIIALLAAAAVFCAGFFVGRASPDTVENVQQVDVAVIQNALSDVSELVSLEYGYTELAQFENNIEFYGVTLPFTTKSFLLTYSGVIKAGVELTEAKAAVSGSVVTVTLPHTKILSHEIDESSIEIFDERQSIFNPFRIDDYSSFCQAQMEKMEASAVADGLLERAAENAARDVTVMLGSVVPDGYRIVVRAA